MPNTKSAVKRLKTNAKCRLRNRIRKSRIHTFEKKLDASIAEGDASAAATALSACFTELDKAAKHGAIHRNKANRKKQRLTARLGAMQGAAEA